MRWQWQKRLRRMKVMDMKTARGMKRGDVLLGSGHTAFYCGEGKIVHASLNELGKTTGGRPGDQTGKEICIRAYYNKPWTSVLCFSEDHAASSGGKNAC